MTAGIRWHQRFRNYRRALSTLGKAVELSRQRPLSELEIQGLIQAFEYTHELAWKTLKDFLEYQGQSDLYGSRDVSRKAFELGLIRDGHGWMDMIKSRNLTPHTYNQETADQISSQILTLYLELLRYQHMYLHAAPLYLKVRGPD